MGLRITGIDGDRVLEVPDSLGGPIELAQRIAGDVVRLAGIGVERQCPLSVRERLCIVTEAVQSVGEIVLRFCGSWCSR